MASSLPLRLRRHRHHHHRTIARLFSSTVSQNPNHSTTADSTTTESPARSSSSSTISDIKSRLKNSDTNRQSNTNPPQQQQQQKNVVSVAEIRKSLSGFRAAPSPGTGPTRGTASIDAIRNSLRGLGVAKKETESNESKGEGRVGGWLSGGGVEGGRTPTMTSIDAIRNSLRGLNAARKGKIGDNEERNLLSLENYTKTLKLKPDSESRGGGEMKIGDLRGAILGKEKVEGEEEMMRMELYRQYDYAELGEKMRMLRPDGGKKSGGETSFSFAELGERLMKLRVIEEREAESRSAFGPLRKTLMQLGRSQPDDLKKWPARGLEIFGRLGEAPRLPPKEELVEKYFHPDNMSSAEKLKIELKKVRDEFKMSDSDSGSTRVQIAQLTTEIYHLSSVLHKKDKHSRRGLVAKVQRRKTLLKYLRRTDWESYRLVLSRFGLRDNPDYKQLAR